MKSMLKHPKIVIAVVMVITLVAGILSAGIVLDNDVKVFFPKDDPSYLNVKELDRTYGSQLMFDLCITTEKETILTSDTIFLLQKMVAEIETFDGVQSVTAITNSDYPNGSADGMSVSALVPDEFTGTDAEMSDLRERLLDWPEMYSRTLYSDDFKSTQIIVRIDDELSAEEQSVLYYEVMEMIEPHDTYPLNFRIAGDPVITQMGKEFMVRDLTMLIPFISLVLFLCLLFAFKRISATLLPLITVMVATAWTVATMAYFDVDFTIVSSCLPVLIIAVGSAYGIHIINHYFHFKSSSKLLGPDAAIDNMRGSLKEVIAPIFLAGFTTVVGFISIISSPIVPLKAFGAFAAIGTLYSLILSLTLIPALLVLSEKRRDKKNKSNEEFNDESEDKGFIHWVISLTQEHGKATFAAVILLFGLSTWGLFSINVESSLINYFPYNSDIRKDSRYISDNFAGTNVFNVVINAPEGKSLADPEILKDMDELKIHLLNKYPEDIGKIISFSDFIKRMNRIMNFPPEAASEDDMFGSEDDLAMDSGDMGSFFDDSDDGMGSFFSDDESADDGMGSFFDSEEESDNSYVESEYAYTDLSTNLNYTEFIMLLQSSMAETGSLNVSVDTLVEKIMAQTNYRGAAYNEIPYDASKYPVATKEELGNLISQYLLLYSGSLDDYATSPIDAPNEARMMIQLKSHSTSKTGEIIAEINNYASHNIDPEWTITNAGVAELELALTNMITKSQITSLLIAIIAVFLIVAVSYRSITAGLIGIIPLAFSILANFGLMSLMDINLDMVTALIASIAIGIGVDYTVHFLSRYKLERAKSDDLNVVTRNTILSTGKGIIINAASVGLGFSVLMFSKFIVLRYIGFLTAVIMVTSSMAALTILPLLLNVIKPKFVLSKESDTAKQPKKAVNK